MCRFSFSIRSSLSLHHPAMMFNWKLIPNQKKRTVGNMDTDARVGFLSPVILREEIRSSCLVVAAVVFPSHQMEGKSCSLTGP